jgi:AAA domain
VRDEDIPFVVDENDLEWQRLSDVEMRSIHYLDPPFWQADAFHLVVGRKGVGKGTQQADLAARVTWGDLGAKRNVIWIASEDSAAIDIKPRLIAAGGHADRVYIVKTWVQLPRDIGALGRMIRVVGDVGLVIIDPVGNHITGKNSNSDTDIRDAIAPLNELADQHETMVIGVRHLTEKEARAGVIAAILGASAWVQVPRAVIAIARDTSEGVSIMQCVMGNRMPPGTTGRAFRIEGVPVEGLENEVTHAVWVGDSTKDVETLIAETAGKEPSRSEVARGFILDALEAAPHGRIESDELDARIAVETGLQAQTIRNLRGGLKNEGLIRSVPEKDSSGQVQRWLIERTNAPRPSAVAVTGSPVTVMRQEPAESGSTTPQTVQEPRHTPTVTGEEREERGEPETVSVSTALLDPPFPLVAGVAIPPRSVESCLVCECPYDPTTDGAESLTCAACVALRRGIVTPTEAGEMRLLTRLALTESES